MWHILALLGSAESALLKDSFQGQPFFDLLIVIPCHGSREVARRNAIRNSWAQYAGSSRCKPCQKRTVKILFVAGQEGQEQELVDEASEFDDLGVLTDFGQFEYYTARAEKTQRSLRYAIEHFRFRLLLKTDTDSWVFVDRLLEFLEERSLFTLASDAPGIYAGDFADGSGVRAVADPQAKWFDGIFHEFTGEEIYPRHAKGAGYILSPDLVEFIAAMGPGEERKGSENNKDEGSHWAHMPRLEDLPSEDVSTGFWLQAVNHTKIEMPVSIKDAACTTDKSSNLVVDHYVAPEEMAIRWCRYLKAGDPCDEDVEESTCQTAQLSQVQKDLELRAASATNDPLSPKGELVKVQDAPRPKSNLLASPRIRSAMLKAHSNIVHNNMHPGPLVHSLGMGGGTGSSAADGQHGHRPAQRPRRHASHRPPRPTDSPGYGHRQHGHRPTKVLTGEQSAWMLMQHGTALSWVSGPLTQS